MNDNVKLWTDALESGEYTQGFNRLGTVDRNGYIQYCCLGVACEVFIKNGGKLEKVIGSEVIYIDRETNEKPACRDKYLPPNVQKWLGLKDDAGIFFIGDIKTTLAYEQDNKLKTFKELAQIIKSEPEGLFC